MDDHNTKPVTKAELKVEITALEERIDGRLGALEERLTEKWRDMQTELLKAFYSFAESNHRRVQGIEADAGTMKDRLAILEHRITELERRVNMPPAA